MTRGQREASHRLRCQRDAQPLDPGYELKQERSGVAMIAHSSAAQSAAHWQKDGLTRFLIEKGEELCHSSACPQVLECRLSDDHSWTSSRVITHDPLKTVSGLCRISKRWGSLSSSSTHQRFLDGLGSAAAERTCAQGRSVHGTLATRSPRLSLLYRTEVAKSV